MLLSGVSAKRKAGRPPMAKIIATGGGNEKRIPAGVISPNGSNEKRAPKTRARRVLSQQAREKIAAAQKKRWAKVRAMQKKETAAKKKVA